MLCSDPNHQPTFHKPLKAGTYKSTCPTCGYEAVIIATTVFPTPEVDRMKVPMTAEDGAGPSAKYLADPPPTPPSPRRRLR